MNTDSLGQYIWSLTERECGARSEDVIEDINDVRNGIFINAAEHRRLGKELAFLVVRWLRWFGDNSSQLIGLSDTKLCDGGIGRPRPREYAADAQALYDTCHPRFHRVRDYAYPWQPGPHRSSRLAAGCAIQLDVCCPCSGDIWRQEGH